MGPVQLHADVLHRLSQTGPLESPWLVAGLAALLVASALAGWLALLAILSALAAVNELRRLRPHPADRP